MNILLPPFANSFGLMMQIAMGWALLEIIWSTWGADLNG